MEISILSLVVLMAISISMAFCRRLYDLAPCYDFEILIEPVLTAVSIRMTAKYQNDDGDIVMLMAISISSATSSS